MLESILKEINSGRTLDPSALAVRLNTSPELVRAMLDHLVRLGRISPVAACRSAGCGDCAVGTACQPGSGARLWAARS